MNILEKYIASKTGDESTCEDGLFISGDFIAVIDGVTSKGKLKWQDKSSGWFAKEVIKQALAAADRAATKDDLFTKINNALSRQYADKEFFLNNPTERLQAVIIIYSDYHRQIWAFGDCQCLVDSEAYRYDMKIDSLVAEIRSVYLNMQLISGKSMEELCAFDPSFEVVFPLLSGQYHFSNKSCEYGFSVLDGFCDNFSAVKVINVKKESIIVLASDGYPKLFDTLHESEEYLRVLKEQDPLCISMYKGDKGFTNGKKALDDRTYIKFTI